MEYRRVALVAGNFAFTFPSKMLGFIKALARPEQTIVQYALGDRAETAQRRIQGLLREATEPTALIGISYRPDDATLAACKSARIPVVLIDEEAPGASTVVTDNVAGGRLAAECLTKAGRKDLAVVCGRTNASGGYNAARRLEGFTKACALRGVKVDRVIEVVDYSFNDGLRSMGQLLDERRPLDGVFSAAGDDCAVGLIKAAQSAGRKVPVDLAVVGYDDVEIARQSALPLTTIRQPLEDMAAAAFEMATTRGHEVLARPARASFAPELVVRQSAP